MKPYFKVLYNCARFHLLRLFKCHGIRVKGILLLGYNTRISVKKTSVLELGNCIVSDGRLTMIVDENARVKIGDHVYFNEGMMISAKQGIEIGDGCQFGPNVKIFDNNHQFDSVHGVLGEHVSERITIGRNCWIASNVTICGGVTIGKGCVIGAGSVVTRDIPAGSLAAGNPCRVIRPITEQDSIYLKKQLF